MAIDNGTHVVAIRSDDQTLHVATAGAMLAHVRPGLPTRPSAEFYDATGQRLRITNSSSGYQFAVDSAHGVVDEGVLLGRIDAALGHLQVALDQEHLSGGSQSREVPRPAGSLPEVLAALTHEFGGLPSGPDSGNWLHRLAHAAGTAH